MCIVGCSEYLLVHVVIGTPNLQADIRCILAEMNVAVADELKRDC